MSVDSSVWMATKVLRLLNEKRVERKAGERSGADSSISLFHPPRPLVPGQLNKRRDGTCNRSPHDDPGSR